MLSKTKVAVSIHMSFTEMKRRSVTFLLMLALPLIFFVAMYYTSETATIPISINRLNTKLMVEDRLFTSLFMAALGIGATAAFGAMTSVINAQKRDQRLLLCGFTALELTLSRIILLTSIMCIATLIFTGVTIVLFSVQDLFEVIGGMFLVGFLGIAFGNFLGTVTSRELEASLGIIAVVGIEIAMGIRSAAVEKYLPWHFPLEIIKIGAFAESMFAGKEIILALLYGIGLFLVGFLIWRIRVAPKWVKS